VTIAKAFAVGKTEVTFAEWDTCVEAGVCPDVPDDGSGRVDRPVMNVGWDDAKQYVAWLSRITGKDYRLLTEAEWEYAARAGSHTRFSFGDDEAHLGDYAWYRDNAGTTAHPVGIKRPNAFGLYDMHGNVTEWVEDVWHEDYDGAPSDGSARSLPADLESGWVRVLRMLADIWAAFMRTPDLESRRMRVHRGGSWLNEAQLLRSARRFGDATVVRGSDLGFRLARTLNP
jgi:formylglycine-generating enzyme required for sulfatase activity